MLKRKSGVLFVESLEGRICLSGAGPSMSAVGAPANVTTTATVVREQTPASTQAPIEYFDSAGKPLVSGSAIDFGTVVNMLTTTPYTKTFGVKNTGDNPVTLSFYFPAGNAYSFPFETSYPEPTLAAGATEQVTVNWYVGMLGEYDGPASYALDATVTNASSGVAYTTAPSLVVTGVLEAPNSVKTVVTARKPAVFTDANDNRFKALLSGPGSATLEFDYSGNSNLTGIELDHTTLASSLKLVPLSGASTRTSIDTTGGLINIQGSLGALDAPNLDLTDGSLLALGNVRSINIGNLSNLTDFIIGSGKGSTLLDFQAGNVADSSMTVDQHVGTIQVNSWTDAGVGGNTLGAFSIDRLVVQHDFTTGLWVYSSTYMGKGNLGTAAIGGAVGSDGWDITGNAHAVSIGAIPAGFSATVGGSLTSLHVAGNDAGVFSAGQFGAIRIGGNLTGKVLAGVNLGADGQIGGTSGTIYADSYSAGTIALLIVDGSASDAFISAGFIPADGLFDNTTGSELGGRQSRISRIEIIGGVAANTRFVAGSFGRALIPTRVDPSTDVRFVVLS